jgi:predicted PurR-regulated permease PerM
MSTIAVGLIFGIGGLELFRMIARELALLVLAISIASALAPIVERLTRSIPHSLAVALVYLGLVLVLVGILGSTIPLITNQVRSLIAQSRTLLPQLINQLGSMGFDTSNLTSAAVGEIGRMGNLIFTLPLDVFRSLLEVVLILFLSLYWLILMPSIKGFYLSFFPEGQIDFAASLIGRMGMAMGGYLRGAAINGVIIGVAQYIGLLIIGVPYALTLGLLAGLLEFFPTIGPIASGGLAVLVGLSVSPRTALIVLIYSLVLQQAEGHILVPIIMRSQTEISPLLAVLAVVTGAAIGGLLGAVIAIPLVSAITVLVKMVIVPAFRKANGAKEATIHN